MKKHIPNAITCCNLLSGCVSIVLTCNNMPSAAAVMIFVAAVFDFLDGFTARLLKAFSPIGGELDSLSDVVSFGVAPSFIVFYYLNIAIYHPMWGVNLPAFAAFLLAAFAALRLAKFNIDTRQKSSFIGLPTPAMAIFVASLPIALKDVKVNDAISGIVINPWFLYILIAVFCFLMVSEIPFFSLKIKNLKFKYNILRYFTLIFAILAVIVMKWLALPLIMLFYMVLSVCCYRGEE